jgi:hypothetical protein
MEYFDSLFLLEIKQTSFDWNQAYNDQEIELVKVSYRRSSLWTLLIQHHV